MKVMIFNLLGIKTFHFKNMYKKFKIQKKNKTSIIKFILINVPRSRFLDRILRLLIDLFLFKWFSFYTR